ncbi:MAG: hypothetical protein J0L86_14445 [Flavobacteriales bacterium]|nr:hypothetical protein [Flavobacteriales bacterium]
MKRVPHISTLFFLGLLLPLLSSCKKEFQNDNFVAYFGGEVTNPNNRFVLFCKNNEVIDTIHLNKDNTFFKKFDSLAPGLYTFKHEPEYQYVYFDKNDSIMVHVNSKDFDESVVFCGRGDEKNNFLMEMYLKNEKDKDFLFEAFDYDLDQFNKVIDSVHKKNEQFYTKKKENVKWSDEFDVFAKASYLYSHYTKKEIYPMIHNMRTGKDVYEKLPKSYYSYRESIDFNNVALADYSPFVMYLNHMLNNVSTIKYHNHFTEVDLALKTNINKLNVADTLIKNSEVKNKILNNIAFQYLLEDQNVVNNQEFLKIYHKFSTDKSQKNEINKIGDAIQLLLEGKKLPSVELVDSSGKKHNSVDLITKNTIIFFWTENANSHMVLAHKKIAEFKKKYPNYHFIAINLDKHEDWKKSLTKYNFKDITELRCADFEDIRDKWVITKIHRTIVVNGDGTIKNAFTNIMDAKFEENLR